jgi:hypothetical protein
MSYTIYEYVSVTSAGEPIEPPASRAASQSLGSAVQLAAGTAYVAIVPDAEMYLRISPDGTAATSADHHLESGATYGFPVRRHARPYLYGLAVS